jgi:tRNA 2-thiouridine synthesizing protein A
MANGQGGIAETMEFAVGEIQQMWATAEEVDLTGLKCPMPALLTRRALRRSIEGALIAVTVTDSLAPLDLRHLCQSEGHVLLDEAGNEKGARRLLIRRGPP